MVPNFASAVRLMRPLLLPVLPASTEMPLSDIAGLYDELRDELRSGGKLAWIDEAMLLLVGSVGMPSRPLPTGSCVTSGMKLAVETVGIGKGPSVVSRPLPIAKASKLGMDVSEVFC